MRGVSGSSIGVRRNGSSRRSRRQRSGPRAEAAVSRHQRSTAPARSRGEWRSIVERWKDSGLTAPEFCQEEWEINPRTLQWWSSQLNRDPRSQVLLEGPSETQLQA